MDLFFEVEGGRTFCIEVGYFDSVLEIKEKVEKYQSIPTPKQTLIFNGQVLQDNDDIEKCLLFHNSRIQLLVSPDTDNPPIPTFVEDVHVPLTKIHLNVKAVSSNAHIISLDIDVNDTVLKLKEKIVQMEAVPVPVNRLLLHVTGTELQDHQLLRNYDVSNNTEVYVNLRPSPMPTASETATGGAGGGGLKKLKVMVLPKSGTKKIPVEVNPSDNVGELRKELQRMNQRLQFHLPQEGYFFIYKQNVMDDDRSFRWHHVAHGDTIEIFNGSVTGGS